MDTKDTDTDATDDAPDDAENAKDTPRSASRGWVSWLLILLVAGAAALYVAKPQWSGLEGVTISTLSDSFRRHTPPTTPRAAPMEVEMEVNSNAIPAPQHDTSVWEAQLEAMETKLAQLQQRVDALEATRSDDALTNTHNDATYGPFPRAAEWEALQARLNTLEASIAQAGDHTAWETEIAPLKTAITALSEHNTTQKPLTGMRLLLAFDRLEHSLHSGKPYKSALDQLTFLLEGSADAQSTLNMLKKQAMQGAASLAQLTQEATLLVEQTLRAQQQQDHSTSGRLRNRFASVISIRKIDGEESANDASSRLIRLEQHMQAGRLAEALNILQHIDDPAIGERFAHWQERGKFALHVPGLLNDLRAHVHHAALNPHNTPVAPHAP